MPQPGRRPPRVSVVLPCYITSEAQLALLDETLSTVDAQSCCDCEVIVIDDGSPLDVTRVTTAHPRTFTVRQPNAGPAVARNTGIDVARGDTFVFLDADDHLLPHALDTGLAVLAAHPECGFAVGAREEMTYEGTPVPWTVAPPPPQSALYVPLLGFEWYVIPPSSAIFRRETVAAVGGFRDPWGADDLDFYLRAAYRFPAHCHQSPPVTRYRRYSTSSSRDGERMLHSIRTVYERQWPLVCGWAEAEAAYRRGLRALTDIFLDCVVENVEDRLRCGNREAALRSARLLALESPERLERLPAELHP